MLAMMPTPRSHSSTAVRRSPCSAASAIAAHADTAPGVSAATVSTSPSPRPAWCTSKPVAADQEHLLYSFVPTDLRYRVFEFSHRASGMYRRGRRAPSGIAGNGRTDGGRPGIGTSARARVHRAILCGGPGQADSHAATERAPGSRSGKCGAKTGNVPARGAPVKQGPPIGLDAKHKRAVWLAAPCARRAVHPHGVFVFALFFRIQQVVCTVRSLLRPIMLAVLPVLVLGACDDPVFGRLDPLIATDTLDLAAPADALADVPSALDVTAAAGVIGGGRFPERVQDSNRGWDLAVRMRDGQVVLLPSGAPGYNTRAGVFGPVQGETFESLRDVPPGARFRTDTVAVMQPGALYVVRSREFSTGFGGCLQYAKLQALSVDAASGAVRVQVATNEQCYDTRLVPAGS